MNDTRRYNISPGDPGGFFINDVYQDDDDIHPMAVCCDLEAANAIVTALNAVQDLDVNLLQVGTVWRRKDGVARTIVSVDNEWVRYEPFPTRGRTPHITRMGAGRFLYWMRTATLVRMGLQVKAR